MYFILFVILLSGSAFFSASEIALFSLSHGKNQELLHKRIEGATGVLLNITGGKSLGLHEIGEAASIIYEQVNENANIILGTVTDESMDQEVTVTIIATGFGNRIQENKSCLEHKTYFENTSCDMQVKATTVVLDLEKEKGINLFEDLSKVPHEAVAKKEDIVFEKEIEIKRVN